MCCSKSNKYVFLASSIFISITYKEIFKDIKEARGRRVNDMQIYTYILALTTQIVSLNEISFPITETNYNNPVYI